MAAIVFIILAILFLIFFPKLFIIITLVGIGLKALGMILALISALFKR